MNHLTMKFKQLMKYYCYLTGFIMLLGFAEEPFALAQVKTSQPAEHVSPIVNVCTRQDLEKVRLNLNGKFHQTCDIDLSGSPFAPIGDNTAQFSGLYDGQGHQIINFHYHEPGQDNVGLFGLTSGAVISNLQLANVDVGGNNNVGALAGNAQISQMSNITINGNVSGMEAVGGAIGNSYQSKFTNLNITVTVNGASRIGGAVGYLFGALGEMVDSSSNSQIINRTGAEYVGGLVGYAEASKIINSKSAGAPFGQQAFYVGGLVGRCVGCQISDSQSSQPIVDTTHYAGGLVGEMTDAEITNSHASGDVIGEGYLGGLVGSSGGGNLQNQIKRSSASGHIKGDGNYTVSVGGLIGDARFIHIEESFATGWTETKLPFFSGGLVGVLHSNASVKNSYATGEVGNPQTGATGGGLIGSINNFSVVTNSYAVGFVHSGGGGLIGQPSNAAVTSSYWDTTQSGAYSSYGGMGMDTNQMQQQSSFAGWDFDTVWEMAGYPKLRWQED